jgi:hypothetical protein
MSRFVAARGRPALLETVKERLDYVKSFPNIDGQASVFHRALAPLFPISEIVTTNWDEYFERFTGAQPFVTDEDWALSRTSLRKVFKLHGSIASPGSLIATSEDYARCYRELGRGLLGARLKELLATKTIVFAGYSLRDDDFARVYKLIASRMGELLPRSYLVTIDKDEPPSVARGMHVIGTSGTHFLSELARQIPTEEFVPESRFQAIPMMRAIVHELHHELLDASEMTSDPALLMCASYQGRPDRCFRSHHRQRAQGPVQPPLPHRRDGLAKLSAAARAARSRRPLAERRLHRRVRQRLTFLISDDADRKLMPIYYVRGGEPLRTRDDYERAAPGFARQSPDAFAYVRRQAERLAPGVVFQHLRSAPFGRFACSRSSCARTMRAWRGTPSPSSAILRNVVYVAPRARCCRCAPRLSRPRRVLRSSRLLSTTKERARSTLGVRVPALLVGPRVTKFVCHEVFDHAVLIKTILTASRSRPAKRSLRWEHGSRTRRTSASCWRTPRGRHQGPRCGE